MKKLLFLVLLGSIQPALAQKDNRIVIGKIDSIHSAILNENRKIWVYVPDQGQTLYEPQRYPVIYLLDGDSHFHSVTGLVRQLSRNFRCPEMIVVGIPNTDRTRDLTPTHSVAMDDGKESDHLRTSGGGENFTAFLEKELIPYIESHYPTAPHRMLIGHSFGGLMVANTLVHHPALFNTYVSIDPSMWWDHKKLLNEETAVLQQNKLKGKSLFLGVANTMPENMDTLRVQQDTTVNTAHIRSILQFAKQTNAAKSSGLRFDWKYYDHDDHGSAPLITEYDALRFIFDFYKPHMTGDPTKMTADMINNHYKSISEKIGYPILPPEYLINSAGYASLEQQKWDQAYAFFQQNINNHPKSFNVYDSMGDYYLARNDKAKAKEYFTKALTLQEFPETRQKLEKLKKE